jgi:signal peptidase I
VRRSSRRDQSKARALEPRTIGDYFRRVSNVAPSSENLTWRSPKLRLRVLVTAFGAAFAIYCFFTWVLWPVKVSGESMMPNFRDGSRHFINKLAYISSDPQRGDVVGLRAPEGEVYLKRVIGLPGERLTFDFGQIQVNGIPLPEPYIDRPIPPKLMPANLKLGTNEYWVIGDNRMTSVRGPVPREVIIGKLVF